MITTSLTRLNMSFNWKIYIISVYEFTFHIHDFKHSRTFENINDGVIILHNTYIYMIIYYNLNN